MGRRKKDPEPEYSYPWDEDTSGDEWEMYTDEDGNSCLVPRGSIPPISCRGCDGPWPYCKDTCIEFID